jgi:two-component system nitrate/nitrite response regulator NarL
VNPVIRVFVFDPVCLSGEALGHALKGRSRVCVTGHGHEIEHLRREPEARTSDLIVVRAVGPADTVRMIKDCRPAQLVIAVGIEDRTSEIVRVIEAGASGYVAQGATPDDLGRVVEEVYDSTFVCPAAVTRAVFDRVRELARADTSAGRAELDRLSGRERQIVALIGSGLSNKEIARELGLALHTVKNHVHRILNKLHVRRRREAGALLPAGSVTGG